MQDIKTAVVTGSTSKIGSELCRILLKKGYHLINIDRDMNKASQVKQKLLDEFPDAKVLNFKADLAEGREIREVSKMIIKHCDCIDLLFHNAGVLIDKKVMNINKIEMHFVVNCLAPYLLTQQLIPLLKKASNSKVVVSGSGASAMARKIKVHQLENPEKFKAMSGAYAQSKAAIKVLFFHLQQQYKQIDFIVVDLPPTKTKMVKSRAMPTVFRWAAIFFATPEKTAKKLYNSTKDMKLPSLDDSQKDIKDELVLMADKFQ